MEDRIYITVKGFKKFCEYFNIKITKENIEKIKQIEKSGENEEKDIDFIISI